MKGVFFSHFLQGGTKARSSSLTSRKPLDHGDVEVRVRSPEVSRKIILKNCGHSVWGLLCWMACEQACLC